MQGPDPYLDNSGRDDVLSGGVKLIPITTPKGDFRVWTRRVGNNPTVKVLLLHGGPGATHEYLAAFDSYFPAAGIEYYYYDQLGSAYSDQPDDPDLWTIPRFVDEVEQVRQALALDRDNPGVQRLRRGRADAGDGSGRPRRDQAPRGGECDRRPAVHGAAHAAPLPHHILRMPPEAWPDPVNRSFAAINPAIYVPMQGPSELGASGTLVSWDRTADLPDISVPTLVIGARHDTMDPAYMEMMASKIPRGTYLFCPDGSHMAMYDDQVTYFNGIIDFIRNVEQGAQRLIDPLHAR